MTIASSLAGGDVGALFAPLLVSGNVLHSFSGWVVENGEPRFQISFASAIKAFSLTFAGVSTPADVRLFVYHGANLLGTVAGSGSGQFALSSAAASITRMKTRGKTTRPPSPRA